MSRQTPTEDVLVSVSNDVSRRSHQIITVILLRCGSDQRTDATFSKKNSRVNNSLLVQLLSVFENSCIDVGYLIFY